MNVAVRSWHRLLLGGAIAFVVVRYAPALFLSYFSSDSIMSATFFRDVFEHSGNPHHFVWGGKSDLFPDQLILFLVYRLTGSGLIALEVCTAVIFLGYVAASLFLFHTSGGKRLDVAAAVSTVLFAGLLVNFHMPGPMTLTDMFMPNMHGGTKIIALVCLALMQRSATVPRLGGDFWWATALCVLTTASDPLFLVVFTAPACTALIAWRLIRTPSWPHPRWLVSIALASMLGFWLGPKLWPAALLTGGYTHLNLTTIVQGLKGLARILAPRVGGYFVVVFTIGAIGAGVATVLLVRGRVRGASASSTRVVMLLFFTGALFAANFGAAILIGSFIAGLGVVRYVGFALVMPVLVLVGVAIERSRWTVFGRPRAVAAGAAVLAVVLTIPLPVRSGFLQQGDTLVPFLESLVQTHGIDSGLADYWYANSLTYLSGDRVRLRAITRDGAAFHWVNNDDWYVAHPDGSPVEFRLILMNQLDPDRIRQRFGTPSRIVSAPAGEQVWLYAPARKISYSRGLGELVGAVGTAPAANAMRLPASSLPSLTGTVDGEAIVARQGRDQAGFLTYGPYIHPRSGRYRIEVTYTYLDKPAAGGELLFDAVLWSDNQPSLVDHAVVPFLDTSEHTFLREFDLQNPSNGPFEARTYYRGSSNVQVRALTIVTLEGADR